MFRPAERLLGMRRTWLTVAAVGTALSVAAALPGPASAQTSGFSEGPWEGYLGLEADYTFATDDGPVPVAYQAMGFFAGDTTAGTFTGVWELDVFAATTVGDETVSSNAIGVGEFNGPTTGVDLELLSVTVTEPTIGLTVTFGADELPGASGGRLEVVGGDCNRVHGTYELDFPDQTFQGQFSAFRSSDVTDESVAEERRRNQAELTARGRELLTDISAGVVDVDAIRAVVEAMEGALQPPSADECGGGSSGSFRAAAAELIDSVLFQLAGSADALDARTLIELVFAGYRSGSFLDDPEAESFWLGEYERAVEAALAGDEFGALGQFSAASRALGRTEEADRIDARMAELGMGS